MSSSNAEKECGGCDVGCKFVSKNEEEKINHEKECFYYLGRTVLLQYKKEKEELTEKISQLKEQISTLQAKRNDLLDKIKEVDDKEVTYKVGTLKECTERRLCINACYDTDRFKFKFYACKTCEMTKQDKFLICQICSENCHKGHLLFEIPSIITKDFLCSCSFLESLCNCTIFKRPPKKIENAQINSLDDCLANFICTKKAGNGYHRQAFYECYTCGTYGTKGCCISCSLICHKGHELKKSYKVYAYECDCSTFGVCKA